MNASFEARLNAAKARCIELGIPIRRTDAALYSILGECLEIAQDLMGDEAEINRLRTLFSTRSSGQRRYMERDPDAHLVTARYVLMDDTRNSVYRYAYSLREATRRGISGHSLPQWLAKNGGVNTLYRERPTGEKTRTIKTLHLTSSVTVPADGFLSLNLMRLPNGFFEVGA